MTSAETFIAQRKASRSALSRVETYPGVLGDYHIRLQFRNYSYTETGAAQLNNGSPTIILPLPTVMSDSLTVQVGQNELGILGTLSAQAASNPNEIGNKVKGVFNAIEAAGKSAGEATGEVLQGKYETALNKLSGATADAAFFAKAGLASVAPDVTNGFGVGTGEAVNPFATLVFNGVDLKTHTFEWLLSPESPSDSEFIKNIIAEIRRNIVPSYEAVGGETSGVSALDRGLLQYPSLLDIKFSGIKEDYYYRLKPCMVQNFVTDFTPNGVAILKGGKPAQIRISMTVQEASIWTSKDYPQGGFGVGTSDSSANQTGEQTIDPLAGLDFDGSTIDDVINEAIGIVPNGDVNTEGAATGSTTGEGGG